MENKSFTPVNGSVLNNLSQIRNRIKTILTEAAISADHADHEESSVRGEPSVNVSANAADRRVPDHGALPDVIPCGRSEADSRDPDAGRAAVNPPDEPEPGRNGPMSSRHPQPQPAKIVFVTEECLASQNITPVITKMNENLKAASQKREGELSVFVYRPALSRLVERVRDTTLPAGVQAAASANARLLRSLQDKGLMVSHCEADDETASITAILRSLTESKRERVAVLSPSFSLYAKLAAEKVKTTVLACTSDGFVYKAHNMAQNAPFESALPECRCSSFPTAFSTVPVPVRELAAGDELTARGGTFSVKLTAVAADGGEATVWRCSDPKGRLLKVPKVVSENWQKKVCLLAENAGRIRKLSPSLARRIALPEQVMQDSDGQVRGFLMPDFGDAFPLSKINSSTYTAYGYTKADALDIGEKLTDLVAFCHGCGLILGDVSPDNILVAPRGDAHKWDVFLIDIDCCTLVHNSMLYEWRGGRPCNMAPERLAGGSRTYDFIREKEDDEFALAQILFGLFMLSSPYSATTVRGDLLSSIEKGHYPYQYGPNHSSADVVLGIGGALYNTVSWLTYRLKEAFWTVFSSNSAGFLPQNRLSAVQWANVLAAASVGTAKIAQQSPMAYEVFPSSPRTAPGISDDDLSRLLA